MDQVCAERRAADIGGPEQQIIGKANKLMGNNFPHQNNIRQEEGYR